MQPKMSNATGCATPNPRLPHRTQIQSTPPVPDATHRHRHRRIACAGTANTNNDQTRSDAQKATHVRKKTKVHVQPASGATRANAMGQSVNCVCVCSLSGLNFGLLLSALNSSEHSLESVLADSLADLTALRHSDQHVAHLARLVRLHDRNAGD